MIKLKVFTTEDISKLISWIPNKEFCLQWAGPQYSFPLDESQFLDYKLHRIDLGVFNFNIGAIKSYRQAGFKEEGTLRECRKIDDEYWSIINMSMLRNEFME